MSRSKKSLNSSDIIELAKTGISSLMEDLAARYEPLDEKQKTEFLKSLITILIDHYQFKKPLEPLDTNDEETIQEVNQRLFDNFTENAPVAFLSFFIQEVNSLDKYQKLQKEWPELAEITQESEFEQIINLLEKTTFILTTLINFKLTINAHDYNSLIPITGLVGIIAGLIISTSLLGLVIGGAVGFAAGYLFAQYCIGQHELNTYLELSHSITCPIHESQLLNTTTRLAHASKDPLNNAMSFTLQENLETIAPKLRI